MVKEIKLTQGQATLVDDEDFEWLSGFKWCAYKTTYTGANRFMAYRQVHDKSILMHRAIITHVLQRNISRLEIVDHINGNPLDNRRENLRVVTPSQSGMNRGTPKNNKSGVKGVYWNKQSKRWRAQICLDRKVMHLGYFTTIKEAEAAYKSAAEILHGEYQRQ